MHITPFGVEQWMNAHENTCRFNLAETCVHSLTVAELLAITGQGNVMPGDLAAMRLTYGAITGSERLRTAVAALHERQGADNVLVTHGTIGANDLVYRTLVEAGDRVVSIVPTYQQHVSIPESLGAEVVQLALRPEDRWLPDLDRLADLVTPGTRLVTLTNPNNPTGALIDRAGLERITAIAEAAGAWILCDEVYRGTEQAAASPSIADLGPRGIATGSTSKAFSLAGLRTGWIVGPHDVLRRAEVHRDYSTISVGMIDDYFAAMALEHAQAILDRGRRLLAGNLARIDGWIAGEPRIGWVRPGAGTTALLSHDLPMSSQEVCERLLAETGVLLTPGSAFGMEGWLRIGFGNAPVDLDAGLPLISGWLATAGSGG